MTEREFCYWLQGLFEVADPKSLDERQTAMIRDHLKLVFTKVTPVRPMGQPIYDNDAKLWRDLKSATSPSPGLMPVSIC